DLVAEQRRRAVQRAGQLKGDVLGASRAARLVAAHQKAGAVSERAELIGRLAIRSRKEQGSAADGEPQRRDLEREAPGGGGQGGVVRPGWCGSIAGLKRKTAPLWSNTSSSLPS